MAGAPYPRPPSSRKPKKLSREESAACMAWKTGNPFMEAHHIITQQALRKRGHADLLYDPRNRLWLTRERHEQHHSCYRKIRRSELPQEALDFAAELDLEYGSDYFTNWLTHHYRDGEVTEGMVPQALFAGARNREAREEAAPAFTGEAASSSPPSVTSPDEGLEAA